MVAMGVNPLEVQPNVEHELLITDHVIRLKGLFYNGHAVISVHEIM